MKREFPAINGRKPGEKVRMDLVEHISSEKRRNLQLCENCKEEFSCEVELEKCWCFSVDLGDETRKRLRENFEQCLCRDCLKQFEAELS